MTKAAHLIAASALALATTTGAEIVPAMMNNNNNIGGESPSSSSSLRQRSALSMDGNEGGIIHERSGANVVQRRLRQTADGNNLPADGSDVTTLSSNAHRSLNWIKDFFDKFSNTDDGDDDQGDGGEDPIIPNLGTVPTPKPTRQRQKRPTKKPTPQPTPLPTEEPTPPPTMEPTDEPTTSPSPPPITSDFGETTTTTAATTTTTVMATTGTCYPSMNGYEYAIPRACQCDDNELPDDNWMNNPIIKSSWIFDTLVACCDAKECDELVPNLGGGTTTTTSTTTTTTPEPTVSPTNEPTFTPTTSISPSSPPTPLPEKWHPKLRSNGDKICEFSSDYPADYYATEEQKENNLFDAEGECCAAYPDVVNEACRTDVPTGSPTTGAPTKVPAGVPTRAVPDHCGLGREGLGSEKSPFWYPHDEDAGGNEADRACKNDADYPDEYYLDDLFCESYLFVTEDECCHEFPTACVVDDGKADALDDKWYPDMDSARANGVLDCVYGDTYPEHFAMGDLAGTHLFDSVEDCCEEYPCGNALEDFWYPVIDIESQSFRCDHGKGYPLWMLEEYHPDNPDRHLFDTRLECEDTWMDLESDAHCGLGEDGLGVEYWYPRSDDGGITRVCANDANYPDNYYLDDIFCKSFLFTTEDECCHENPTACEDTGGKPMGLMWYPDMASATANGVLDCVYGRNYPELYTMPDLVAKHLFDTQEDCCTEYPTCGNIMDEFWYPVIDIDEQTSSCEYGTGYPLWMLEDDNAEDHLFDSETDCEDAWGVQPTAPKPDDETEVPSVAPSGSPSESPSLVPSSSPTLHPRGPNGKIIYAYPDFNSGNNCLMDDSWPGYYDNNESNRNFFLFSSVAECCEAQEYACTAEPTLSPSLTPSKNPSVSPSDSPSKNPTNEPSTAPSESPTNLPSTSPTDRATGPNGKTIYAYPDIFDDKQICFMDSNYPNYFDQSDSTRNFFLFDSVAECCMTKEYACTAEPTLSPSKNPSVSPSDSPSKKPTESPSTSLSPSSSPTPLPVKWFPKFNDDDGTKICEFSSDYPEDFYASDSQKEAKLFDTEVECCEAFVQVTNEACMAPEEEPKDEPTDPEPTAPQPDMNMYWHSDVQAEGNVCIYGINYPWWMDTTEYRASQLFDTEALCCLEHSCDDPPVDNPLIAEGFEGDMETQSWVHGGTTTHVADWHITSHKSVSGTHSLRSANLNNHQGKSSDIALTVDLSVDTLLTFSYDADVFFQFEHFEFQVDGQRFLDVQRPTGGWTDYELSIPAGEHEISFHVISPSTGAGFDRSASLVTFGTGVVYVDDLKFMPMTR